MNIFDVELSKQAMHDLRKVPSYIAQKLQAWIHHIAYYELHETRRVSGYHDEQLKGERFGQRSIRLNRSYRAIYQIDKEGSVEIICVLEVNKHDY